MEEKLLNNGEVSSEEVKEENLSNEEKVQVAEPLSESLEELAEVKEEEEVKEEVNEWADLKTVLDNHMVMVKNLLKVNKTKDANVSSLAAELAKYRDDFKYSLLKSFITNVIGFREDCKKTLRDLSSRELTEADVKKYLGFLSADFEDFLVNVGIEVKGENLFLNRKNINEEVKGSILVEEPSVYELPELEVKEIATREELLAYLQEVEKYIQEILNNNAELDKLLAQYIANAKIYDQGAAQVALYPLVRELVALQNLVNKDVEEIQEFTAKAYFDELEKIINKLEDLLVGAGVKIDSNVDNVYNPKTQRAIKFSIPEDPELNGTVANKFTDCYMVEDKVIYPQKVDLYKI